MHNLNDVTCVRGAAKEEKEEEAEVVSTEKGPQRTFERKNFWVDRKWRRRGAREAARGGTFFSDSRNSYSCLLLLATQ